MEIDNLESKKEKENLENALQKIIVNNEKRNIKALTSIRNFEQISMKNEKNFSLEKEKTICLQNQLEILQNKIKLLNQQNLKLLKIRTNILDIKKIIKESKISFSEEIKRNFVNLMGIFCGNFENLIKKILQKNCSLDNNENLKKAKELMIERKKDFGHNGELKKYNEILSIKSQFQILQDIYLSKMHFISKKLSFLKENYENELESVCDWVISKIMKKTKCKIAFLKEENSALKTEIIEMKQRQEDNLLKYDREAEYLLNEMENVYNLKKEDPNFSLKIKNKKFKNINYNKKSTSNTASKIKIGSDILHSLAKIEEKENNFSNNFTIKTIKKSESTNKILYKELKELLVNSYELIGVKSNPEI